MRVTFRAVFLITLVAGVCGGQTPLRGGTWRCWSDAGLARTLACGADCIWLAGSGLAWRYDLKTAGREVFTPCDGLPLEQDVVTRVAVAGDGTCVIGFSGRALPAYLYRPGQGWHELPLPAGGGEVSFGPGGAMYCLQWNGVPQTRIWRRNGADWEVVGAVPACQAFVPLKSGFLLGHVRVERGTGSRSAVAYVGPDGGKPVVYEREKDLFMDAPRRHFHAGGETYVVFGSRTGQDAYRRVTPRKLLPDERAARLDPANTMPLPEPSGHPEIDRDRRRVMMVMPGLLPALLPPEHLADHGAVLDGRRYAYDPARRAWKDLAAEMAPVSRNVYDPVTGEAWWSTTVDGRRVWQLVKLEGNRRRPLRDIPEPNILGGFRFKDRMGRWWGAGKTADPETFFAFRLDDNDDRIRRYPCPRGIDGGYRPQVQLAPKGNVWIWSEKTTLRYDEANDRFVEEEPWEDFAFEFGPWRLSMAGAISSFGQAVYRKEDGLWRQMPEPFGEGSLRGAAGMIRGDRMLTCGAHGVLEYSAKADRWVLLHEYGGFRAGFTATGQRVLVNRYCVLVYDGDPMVPASRKAQQEQKAAGELLKLLDSDRWRVREDATAKLKKLYPNVRDRIAAAAKDPSLSPEVRLRCELILRDSQGRLPAVSLFRSMHPLVKAAP